MSSLQPLSPLSPLRPSVLSWPLCPLYCPLSTALFPSKTICPLWGPPSSLRPSVLSTAICLLYSPLSPLWPSVPSTALCPLYGPLSPLRPPVPSEKLQNKQNDSFVSQNVLQNAFHQNSKVYRNLFCISDNRDYHDYHSSEILNDNHEIAIIALVKKVAIIVIITSNKKR
jgi:hypothetical protein